MKSLRIEPEKLVAGKRYFAQSKDETSQVVFKLTSLTKKTCHDCSKICYSTGISVYYLHGTDYNFYTCPDDFYLKWNQSEQSCSDDIFAVMGIKNHHNGYCPASLDLATSQSRDYKKCFSDIPDEPETIVIDGKTYNHSEVIERLKELKTVKE